MRFATLCFLLMLLLGLSAPVGAQVAFLDTDVRVPEREGSRADGYGSAVGLSADGSTAAVGAPNSNGRAGAVHLFRREGGAWTHLQRISLTETPPAEGETGARFGTAIAVSADGSVIVVTAPQYRFDESVSLAGGVFAFERNADGRWTKAADLLTENAPGNAVTYTSLGLSPDGNRVALSAATPTPIGAPTVLTFERVDGTWTEQAPVAFESDGEDAPSGRGSLAMSGDGRTVALYSSSYFSGEGAALVFDYDGTTWQQQGVVEIADGTRFDNFFRATLDGDGDVMAVTERVGGADGEVVMFSRTGDTWTQQDRIEPAYVGMELAGGFGSSLALTADGRRLVTTAPRAFDRPTVTYRGRVFFYADTGSGGWVAEDSAVLPEEEAVECTALGLSASGATTLLGCGTDASASDGLIGIAVVLEDFAVANEGGAPTAGALRLGVAPNPVAVSQAATVRLDLTTSADVRVEAFDVLGRRVALLHDGPLSAGPQTLAMPTSDRPAGLYVVRVTMGGQAAATTRFTVVR